jgi:hypothetical protein
MAVVERETDALAGQPFAALGAVVRTELVDRLDEAHRRWRADAAPRPART